MKVELIFVGIGLSLQKKKKNGLAIESCHWSELKSVDGEPLYMSAVSMSWHALGLKWLVHEGVMECTMFLHAQKYDHW